jgi:hypothetical protein
VLCSPVNLMLSHNNNIRLRGLMKSARRRVCALARMYSPKITQDNGHPRLSFLKTVCCEKYVCSKCNL